MMKGEANLQAVCIKWFGLQFPKLEPLLFHIPNGGSRNVIEAANLKKQGVRPGVADLILLFPKSGHGSLCIEMKYKKGKQQESQKKWQKMAEAAGNKYVVCRTLNEFMIEVKNYLGVER